MPEILQEKLHCVDVSNVDAKDKAEWLKLWNGNRFDKDALHFPKLSFSDFALDDWLSKYAYWAHMKKKPLKNFKVFFSSPLQLHADVPTLSDYLQTWKFAAFNSIFYCKFKSGKVKKHNAWDEQPNINLAMKRVLYKYNLLFILALIFTLQF